MKTYKVLWIDDDFETLDLFSGLAKSNDILLDGFKSYEEGFANFESKVFEYDAILLDALFFKTKSQVSGSEDSKGLAAAKDKIAEFRRQRNIPYFILSGQTKLEKDSTFTDTYGNYYKKQNPEDVKRLFQEIKEAADNEPYTRLRHKYQNVFDVCTEQYYLEVAGKHLIDVLFSIENPGDKFDDEKYFNGIRKVVEYVFRAANKIGLLHDKCIPGGLVNLTWSSMFLAGHDLILKPSTNRISCTHSYFSSILANNIKSLLDITSAASHTEGDEKENAKLNFSEYKKQVNSNYLLYSLAFQVMDLVLWFKKCSDENSSYAENIKRWKETTTEAAVDGWIKGAVVKIDSSNGFGTFQSAIDRSNLSIPPPIVKSNSLKVGDKIEVRTKMDAAGSKLLIADLRKA